MNRGGICRLLTDYPSTNARTCLHRTAGRSRVIGPRQHLQIAVGRFNSRVALNTDICARQGDVILGFHLQITTHRQARFDLLGRRHRGFTHGGIKTVIFRRGGGVRFLIFNRVESNGITCTQSGITPCCDLSACHRDVFLRIQAQIASRIDRACFANHRIAVRVIPRRCCQGFIDDAALGRLHTDITTRNRAAGIAHIAL